VVWVRQFGTLFGSTVYSVALVTALFMLGLGVGGWLAGAWADRAFRADPLRPLRGYGYFELGIALGALLAMLVIPQLAELAARTSSYEVGEHGWHWLSPWSSAVRYGCATLLLAPVTLLMGGTLTLLIRFLVAEDLSAAGWRIGLLYGVNTAGAALGCLLTDTLLVPLVGLRATQLGAVVLNVAAGLGALLLARVLGPRMAAPPREPAGEPATPRAQEAALVAWIGLVVLLTGFASMAMQVVWFRHLSSLFGGTREVFSLLLTVILVGIWLGSLAAGWLERVTRRPVHLLLVAQVLFVAWTLNALLLLDRREVLVALREAFAATEGAATWLRQLARYRALLAATAWVVGPPAFLAGAAFPLANAIVQRARERVGGRAGLLYLANTSGGVLGSLVAGLVLLPRLGVQATAGVAAASALAAAFVLGLAARRVPEAAPGRLLPVLCFGFGLLSLVGWRQLPDDRLVRTTLPPSVERGEQILALREGVNETLAILSVPGVHRTLWTNGHNMSGTGFAAQRYMRAFVHVPLLATEGIERVMVMCFGVGNTTRAALLHPGVREVDVVDLSPDVLEHAPWFEPINGRPLEDPRVSVYVNDARLHLRMMPPERYDLITGEPPPIAFAGVVSLYTREFFELVRSRLRPGGVASYWLPIDQVNEGAARALVRAFVDVFPEALLLGGYDHHLMLVGRKDAPLELDPERVRAKLAAEPALRRELWRIALDTPVDLAGAFAASPATLRRATAGTPALRDDHPILEYATPALHADARLPADLFDVADLEVWCPRCRTGALAPDEQALLDGYLQVTAAVYASERFLSLAPGRPERVEAWLGPGAERAAASFFYLQALLGRVDPAHERVFAGLWQGEPPEAAARRLEAYLANAPQDALARVQLAELLFESGQPEEAQRQLARVLERDPDHAAARASRGRHGPPAPSGD